jgi:hypothetical protein
MDQVLVPVVAAVHHCVQVHQPGTSPIVEKRQLIIQFLDAR